MNILPFKGFCEMCNWPVEFIPGFNIWVHSDMRNESGIIISYCGMAKALPFLNSEQLIILTTQIKLLSSEFLKKQDKIISRKKKWSKKKGKIQYFDRSDYPYYDSYLQEVDWASLLKDELPMLYQILSKYREVEFNQNMSNLIEKEKIYSKEGQKD